MPVVAQLSDLHLSPRVPERQAQAELVLAGINTAKPDLTVVTGDLTDDGWDRPDDLVWAKQWMDERLDHEWFAVPGNHDVGNFVSLPEGKINSHRVKHWEECFASPTLTTVEGWFVLGLNSMLFGSGIDAEREQARWLHEQLITLDMFYAKLAVFMHSPLFVDPASQPEAQGTDYWLGPHEPRQQFREELNMIDTTVLIGSGHVHQTREEKGVGSLFHDGDAVAPTPPQEKGDGPLFRGGAHIVWAPPASGTWVHAPGLPNPPAPDKTGFVLHHLGDDGSVRSEVVECAPMLKTVFYDPSAS